ncbi:putative sporulation protein YtxC [Peptococcaceae bacterium 1198_IL3148]
MIPSISIGTSQYVDVIKSNLNRQISNLENNGLKLEIVELPAGKYTFLSCNINGKIPYINKSGYQIFKKYVAHAVSDVIVNQWQNILINNIIKENYYYFNEDEKDRILAFAQDYVQNKNTDFGIQLHSRRWEQINQRLNEYLENNDQLVVEGFIRFRLKEYVSDLKEAIDNAVDDFLMEREYGEFIQLLRYFVDIQDSKLDLAHVVVKPNGSFALYDNNERAINNQTIEDFILDVNDDINYEDLLVSALISLSPRKIVFHHNEKKLPKTTLKTIQDVFVGRVETCVGCEICNGQINN